MSTEEENNKCLTKRYPPRNGVFSLYKNDTHENQDGGVGRHTVPPRTTRTDRESNSKGDQHQGNRK